MGKTYFFFIYSGGFLDCYTLYFLVLCKTIHLKKKKKKNGMTSPGANLILSNVSKVHVRYKLMFCFWQTNDKSQSEEKVQSAGL